MGCIMNTITDPVITANDNAEFLGQVIDAYRHEGFDAGYQQATRDLLECLVLNSEQFLSERPEGTTRQELRRVLYAFVDRLERQLDRNCRERGYVESGLGI
jgi:hypothetical protein